MPKRAEPHTYWGHYHLEHDEEQGQREFEDDINRIFAAHHLPYEVGADGSIHRTTNAIAEATVAKAEFSMGDTVLDQLLATAQRKYLSSNPVSRRESLEALWDAWERLKTLEKEDDKKASTKLLLDKIATEPRFRLVVETDARELTDIGNDFRIRHSERGKFPVADEAEIDYLFSRLLH